VGNIGGGSFRRLGRQLNGFGSVSQNTLPMLWQCVTELDAEPTQQMS
jgi:hypothetical protein